MPEPAERGEACGDEDRAACTAGQADSLIHRLEPIGKLELVAFGASEELESGMALGHGLLDRLERGHESNSEARELRVIRLAIHVGAAGETEPALECDRPTIELHRGETHDVIVREGDKR